MIIHNLRAENLFKYARLEITDLPERARIAITGPNESGKSAIGEAICLALFGRSFNLAPEHAARALKWHQTNGFVELDFVGRDGRRYTIARYFDSDGGHRARLGLSGAAEPLAKGVEAVNRVIEEVVGFDYAVYLETCYLAQQEFGIPHPARAPVKRLLGIDVLQGVGADLEGEVETAHQSIREIDARCQEIEAQLALLNVQSRRVAELEAQQAAQADQGQACAAQAERWRDFASEFTAAVQGVEGAGAELLGCTLDISLDAWQSRARGLEAAMGRMRATCEDGQADIGACPGERLLVWTGDLRARLDRFTAVEARVAGYRAALAGWLGEGSTPPVEASAVPASESELASESVSETPYPQQQAALDAEMSAIRRRRGRARLGAWLMVLLALVGLSGWWLLGQAPTAPAAQRLSDWLSVRIDPLPLGHDLLFAGVGSLFGLFALGFLARGIGQSGRLAEVRQRRESLEERARATFEELDQGSLPAGQSLATHAASVSRLRSDQVQQALSQWQDEGGAPFLSAEALETYCASLKEELDAFQDDVMALQEEINVKLDELREEQDACEAEVRRLDAAIDEERQRRDEDAGLRRLLEEQAQRRAAQQRFIAVRGVARSLIDGACKRMAAHFTQEMEGFIAKLMPLFTAGRYQYLQVNDRFEVQVFSTEKNDFVRLPEVSTGTQRQLWLAVRLALVQALVAGKAHGRQFVVLDEPFAFSDAERIRDSLHALPRISDEIAQLWIIGQDFDPAVSFDLHLRCSLDSDTLVTSGLPPVVEEAL